MEDTDLHPPAPMIVEPTLHLMPSCLPSSEGLSCVHLAERPAKVPMHRFWERWTTYRVMKEAVVTTILCTLLQPLRDVASCLVGKRAHRPQSVLFGRRTNNRRPSRSTSFFRNRQISPTRSPASSPMANTARTRLLPRSWASLQMNSISSAV